MSRNLKEENLAKKAEKKISTDFGKGKHKRELHSADDPHGAEDSGLPGTGTSDLNPAAEAGLGGNKGMGTARSNHNMKK